MRQKRYLHAFRRGDAEYAEADREGAAHGVGQQQARGEDILRLPLYAAGVIEAVEARGELVA